jgi:hypothetical protein
MMGSTEDPENGPAVATAVFGAVAVYGVSINSILSSTALTLDNIDGRNYMLTVYTLPGVSTFLRQSGLVTYTGEQKGCDYVIIG